MKRKRLIILGVILVMALAAGSYLVQPRITYNGQTMGLSEINAIRTGGKDAQYCVQQVNAFSHFIGESFDFHCFDTEAEATADTREVQAAVKALESR